MASSRIKGITIELGGDTTGLEAALKDVNKRTQEVQSELKDVQRLLKFDPNNVELLAQRQQLLTEAIESSTEKLNQLRSAQSQVEQQFRSGQIGEEQYRAFRRELQEAEQQLNGFEQALSDMNEEQQRVQRGTRDLQTLFEATGSSVEDYAGVIGQRLVHAIQNGTATSRDLEYAFQRIGRQSIGASSDIEQLRTSLQSVDSGNSIQNIRRDLQQLQSEADEAAESVEGIGAGLENVAGALVAGGGIAGAIEQALDTSSLNTKIEISMDIPESSIEAVKASVREVTAVIGDEEAALEGVRRQWALNKDSSDETNQAIITGATTIAKAYAGIDFTELIQETNEISAALKISDEEALGLTNSLLKMGFPPEQLDIIAEYGTQLQRAGYSAEEVQAIMEAGVQTDSWNIDVLLDGLKEGRIVLSEFGAGVDDATAELIKGTEITTKQLQEWGAAVAAGGEGGSKAMVEVAKALEGVKDETTQNLIGVKLFGTLYEEHGSNLTQTLINAENATVDLRAGIDNLAESTEGVKSDSAVKFAQAIQDVKTAAEPTLAVIADIISKIAGWISENPKLAATITAIVGVIGTLYGIFLALAPVIAAVVAGAGILGISIGALSGIVVGVVAAIAGLVAAGVWLYQNWDEISSKAVEIWGSLTDWFAQTWETIKQGFSETWEGLKKWLSNTWESIKETASTVWNGLTSFFANWWDEILAVFTGPVGMLVYLIANNWDAIKSKTSDIFNGIKGFISSTWTNIKSTASSLVEGIKNTVRDKFEAIKIAVSEKMLAVKNKITEIWKQAESFLKNINLLQIGKNIIQGLINGIGDMVNNVKEKAKSVADAVTGTLRKILDIHSPSRVTTKIGEETGQGFVNGIDKKAKDTEEAAKKVADAAKQGFDTSKKWIEEKKKYNEMSLAEELAAWERVQERYKAGSKEREEAERNVYRVKKEINDKLLSLNDEYTKKISDANQKLIDEEKALTEEYNKAVEARTKSLYSFAGLFDEINNKTEVSGQQLVNNLKGQVETFAEWSENIKELAARGIDEGLLAELQNMGPKAYAEIAALTTLTDEQLSEYSNLWLEKNEQAKTQAVEELEGLRVETENKINALHEKTEEQLELLKKEWINKVYQIRRGTEGEFNVMSTTMPVIGKNAMHGLLEGMVSMEGSLMAKARQIARDIKRTIQDALDIHSPSRVMRDEVGKWIPLGLAEGIESRMGAVIEATRKMADAAMPDLDNAYSILSSGSQMMNQGSTSNNQYDQSKTYQPQITIINQVPNASPSELARKALQAQRQLAMEWGIN